eukprot:s1867_g12.t1
MGPQVARTVPARSSSSGPLQGQLPLLRSEEIVPLSWQPQQWRFGRWQALPELPLQRRLGPALRQVAQCAQQTSSDALWRSEAAKDGALPVRGSALAGLLAYDLVQWTQPLALEHPPEPSELLAALYRVDRWLVHQRSTGKLHLLAAPGDPWALQVAECLDALLQEFQAGAALAPEASLPPMACYTSSIDDETHIDAVKQVQDAIRDGQFYQLNFGRSWQGELRESPWQLMQKLFKHNAAPYSGFLQLQVDGLSSALCSCSPELLLSARDGGLSTCPIKGTCARSKDAREDLQLRQEMVASQKEVAEHMMLVDLERHDLGVASCPSSVAWDRWRVESFPNIQHMVSKVTGRLCPSSDVWAALEAVFPGGSITGCPKTATIAAIDALEREPRRCWTGSLGFADLLTGDGQWNILIRTLEAEAEDSSWRAVVKAGGGLTIGSDPAAEVQEAKLKAARILQLAFNQGTTAVQRRGVEERLPGPDASVREVPRNGVPRPGQAEVAQQIAVQDVAGPKVEPGKEQNGQGGEEELEKARLLVNDFLQKNRFEEGKANSRRSTWFSRTYPLHEAVKEENLYIVSKLLLFGADPSLKDMWGWSAYDYGRRANEDIAKVFEEYRKKTIDLGTAGELWKHKFVYCPPPIGWEKFFAELELRLQ